jgi:membrane protein DedA with SNARE-associated domain
MIGWAIGFYGGRPYLERHGRWLHLSPAKLEKAERWFERYEDWAVFLGRLTPVVRSFVSVPAGVFEARFVRYTWLTLLGSAIWCFLFAGAGFAAGEAWEDFHHAFRYVEYVVAVAIVSGAAWLGWRYFKRRKARLAEDSSGA